MQATTRLSDSVNRCTVMRALLSPVRHFCSEHKWRTVLVGIRAIVDQPQQHDRRPADHVPWLVALLDVHHEDGCRQPLLESFEGVPERHPLPLNGCAMVKVAIPRRE